MDELTAAGSLTVADLFDPDGGSFSWNSEPGLARNSFYGDFSFLTPLIELETEKATQREREQYEQFRNRYQSYWRDYFDPIGVRFKIGRTISVETHILPKRWCHPGEERIEVMVERFIEADMRLLL